MMVEDICVLIQVINPTRLISAFFRDVFTNASFDANASHLSTRAPTSIITKFKLSTSPTSIIKKTRPRLRREVDTRRHRPPDGDEEDPDTRRRRRESASAKTPRIRFRETRTPPTPPTLVETTMLIETAWKHLLGVAKPSSSLPP